MHKKNTNIIFIGYAVPKEEMEYLSGISVAGNKMQLNILRELGKAYRKVFSTTVYPVAAFPREKKLYYRLKKLAAAERVNSVRIPFINIPVVKQVMQICGNYELCKRVIAKYANGKPILFTFNMYPQVGIPAAWLKKEYGVEIVCLLADLPIDDNYSRRGIAKYAIRVLNRLTEKCISNADKVIVLNEKAWEKYAPGAEHIVIDGGIDPEEIPSISADVIKERRNLLYSGALSDYSGIKELIEAVSQINDDIELDIYGDGPLRGYVERRQSDRIHYCGVVSNGVVMRKQQEAYLLVNPRPVDDEIAKVTFPSKIFEYMLSGTPILSTKLNGFSADYDDLIFFCRDNRVETLKNALLEMLKSPYEEYERMARRAREYVIANKTWEKQVKRMICFIDSNLF